MLSYANSNPFNISVHLCQPLSFYSLTYTVTMHHGKIMGKFSIVPKFSHFFIAHFEEKMGKYKKNPKCSHDFPQCILENIYTLVELDEWSLNNETN